MGIGCWWRDSGLTFACSLADLDRRGVMRGMWRFAGLLVVTGCLHTQVWPAAAGTLRAGQEVEFRFSSPRTLPLASGAVQTSLPNIVSLDGDVAEVRGDTAFVKVIAANNGSAFINLPYEATATVPLDSTVTATWDHRSVPFYLVGLAALVAAGIGYAYLTR